jgi:hypothetical protein
VFKELLVLIQKKCTIAFFSAASQIPYNTYIVQLQQTTINAVRSNKSPPRSSCLYIASHSFPSYFNFRYRGHCTGGAPRRPFTPRRLSDSGHVSDSTVPLLIGNPLALLQHATRVTFSLSLERLHSPVCGLVICKCFTWREMLITVI